MVNFECLAGIRTVQVQRFSLEMNEKEVDGPCEVRAVSERDWRTEEEDSELSAKILIDSWLLQCNFDDVAASGRTR